MPHNRNATADAPRKNQVLILSSDPVAAALVGALVETLGYAVSFRHDGEDPTLSLRRGRPAVAMLDGADALMISDAVLGHAAMLDIGVVVYGSREALDRLRLLAHRHRLHTLLTPPSLDAVADATAGALAGRGDTGGAQAGRAH